MASGSRLQAAVRQRRWPSPGAWQNGAPVDGLMILRPLETPPVAGAEFLSAWTIVERMQRQPYDGCWMITQPSHAVLAGDFAAKMTGPNLPRMDAALLRAIALHDAGWGVPDAQA